MKTWIKLSVMAIVFINTAIAQVSTRELPYSIVNSISRSSVPIVEMQPVNVDSLLREDESADPSQPPRFGYALQVNINLLNSGEVTTLADGSQLHRVSFLSNGAKSINLIFNEYNLAPGAKLWLYNTIKSN